MRRREFLGALAGAVWPITARAQQPAMPVVGFLHPGSFDGYANQVVAFRQGLKEAEFTAGQNVTIEYRWAAGQYDHLPALAAELVSRQAIVLYAAGGQLAVRAARAASATLPIVFTTGGDPIETGLVASLSKPDGNMTGVSFAGRALGPKRLELIRELLPQATKIAVLQNPRNPVSPAELTHYNEAAAALHQQLHFVSAKTIAEIDQAFVEFGQQRPDALVINGDLLFTSQRDLIVALAARHRIPTIYHADDFTRAGGLISYGASPVAATRQAGNYIGRILKGAKPDELPVLLPTKFELVINLKTAKALGLKVPESFVLYRADEVIE
jgi:putative ABC transport system substrate-binding protein